MGVAAAGQRPISNDLISGTVAPRWASFYDRQVISHITAAARDVKFLPWEAIFRRSALCYLSCGPDFRPT